MLHPSLENFSKILFLMNRTEFHQDCAQCWKEMFNIPAPPKLEKISNYDLPNVTKTKIFTPITVSEQSYFKNNLKREHTDEQMQPLEKKIRLYPLHKIEEDEKCIKSKKCCQKVSMDDSVFSKAKITKPTVKKDGHDQLKPNSIDNNKHIQEVEKAKYERNIKLYQFLIDLLEENNPCVTWIRRSDGMFKIVDSEQFARMWGEVKLNPTMSYEKLARSFRHYYKKGILDSDSAISKTGKRKLYYKFGVSIIRTYLNSTLTLPVDNFETKM